MTHKEVIEGEIVERYVLNSLSPDDRRAFQEHFFECGDCFARAQETSRFVAGVRHASRAGVLSDREPETAAAGWAGWFKPAFAAAAFATVLLTVALGWLLLGQIPRLREDIARERQAREQAERDGQRRLAEAKEANEALAEERQRGESERAKLEGQLELLAQNRPVVPERPGALPRERPQANAPLVILDAVRGPQGGGHQLTLAGGSAAATIWIEVGPGGRFDSYRLQILKGGRAVETVSGARPNSYGALAVAVPTRSLPPGKYLVRLFGLKDKKPELVGEYELAVRGAR